MTEHDQHDQHDQHGGLPTEESGHSEADTGTDPGTGVGDATDGTPDAPADQPDTFTRDYVEQLRSENATHRSRSREAAERADALARQLWAERVAATNILADPSDLPFDADALEDMDRIQQLARQLVAEKPHLRSRKILQRVGQGEGSPVTGVSLVDLLRASA